MAIPNAFILSIDEVYSGRSGSINSLYERRYTRSFEVVTTDRAVGATNVILNLGQWLAESLGTLGVGLGLFYTNGLAGTDGLYEEDRGAFLTGIQADAIDGPEGGGIAWRCTAQYEPWNPSTAGGFGSDPTEWKVRVQFGGERTERVVDFDNDGTPIRNSAGDRFGDPVTVDDHITTLVITRNELVSAYDPALASAFSDTTNAAAWNGIPAGQAKMGIITTSEEKFDSNGLRWYYTVTYPVEISRKVWRKDLLDQGFNELDGSTPPKPKPIMDGGQPVADPVALDGFGHRLPTDGTPVTLTFNVFDVADWTPLGIDLSLRLGL